MENYEAGIKITETAKKKIGSQVYAVRIFKVETIYTNSAVRLSYI